MSEQQESLFEQIQDALSGETPHNANATGKDWSTLDQRFSYALQYPTTIVPLFMSALVFMLIMLGQLWLPAGLLWFVVFGALAGAITSFGVLYFLKYEEEYRRHAQERTEYELREKKTREVQRVQRLRETLRTGFTEIRSAEGERALTRLTNEFDQLQSLVNVWPSSGLVSISQIQVLAEQTYRQGLNVLSSVLDLLLAIEVTDKKGLTADIQALVNEIEELTHDVAQGERLKIRRAMLSEIRGRLERLSVQELRAEEFLLKSNLIEGSLNKTRMELASLKVDISEGGGKEVTEALQRTIENARNVLDEMRELGF